MGEGILAVIDMLGLTIRDLRAQLDQERQVVASLRNQLTRVPNEGEEG